MVQAEAVEGGEVPAKARVCVAAAAALGAATALAALAAPDRRGVDDDARSSSRGSSACMARLVLKESASAQHWKLAGGEEEEHPGVWKGCLLPASEPPTITKTCRLCGHCAPCAAPCPAALTAVVLHGLQLQHSYSTGRFKVACFGSTTPSNTPSGSGCSTPPQSPRSSLTACGSVHSCRSEVAPSTIARYPAILGAAEALVSALPITPGLLQRGPGSVASGASTPRPPCSSPAPSCGSRVSSGGREVVQVVQVQHHFYHHHTHHHDHHHHHHYHHHHKGHVASAGGQHITGSTSPGGALPGAPQHNPGPCESACEPATRATTPGLRCMSRASSLASDGSARSHQRTRGSSGEGSVAQSAPLSLEEVIGLDTSRVQRRGRFVVIDVEAISSVPTHPGPATTTEPQSTDATRATPPAAMPEQQPTEGTSLGGDVLGAGSCETTIAHNSGSPDAPWLDSASLAEIVGAAVAGPAERVAEEVTVPYVAGNLQEDLNALHSDTTADAHVHTLGEQQPHEQCLQVRVGRSASDAARASPSLLDSGVSLGLGLSSAFGEGITAAPPVGVTCLSSPSRPVGSSHSSLEGRSSLPLPTPTASTPMGAEKLNRTSSAGGWDLGAVRTLSRQSSAGVHPQTLPPVTPARTNSNAGAQGVAQTPLPTPRAYRKGRFNIQELLPGGLESTPAAAAGGPRSSQSAFTAHSTGVGWSLDGTGMDDPALLTAISAGVAETVSLATAMASAGEVRSPTAPLQKAVRRAATVGAAELTRAGAANADGSPDLTNSAGHSPRAPTSGKSAVYRGLAFPVPGAAGERRESSSSGRGSGDDETQAPPASFACWVPPADDEDLGCEPCWVRSPGSSECSLDGYRAPPVSMTGLLELRQEREACKDALPAAREAVRGTGHVDHARLAAQRPPALSVVTEVVVGAAGEGGLPPAPLSTRRVGRFTILEEGE